MPNYDYKCTEGHTHERVGVRYNDWSPKTCPECGGDAIRQWGAGQRPINTGTPIHHGKG